MKQLRGMLPICSSCKSIRDDDGYWQRIEAYIQSHSEASFTHGLCPPCAQKLFPDVRLPASAFQREAPAKARDRAPRGPVPGDLDRGHGDAPPATGPLPS